MAKQFNSGDILTAEDMNAIVTNAEAIKREVSELKSDLSSYHKDYKPFLEDTKETGGVTTIYEQRFIAGNSYIITNKTDRYVDMVVGVKDENGSTIETLCTINKNESAEVIPTKSGRVGVYSNQEVKFIIENKSDIYYKVVSTQTDVANCVSNNETISKRIDNLEGIGFPSYFNENVFNTSNSIKSHMQSVGRNGFSFVFCTDLHWPNNEKHSPSLIEKVKKNTFVEDVFLGGDYINNYVSSSDDAIYYMRECISAFKRENTYALLGNHDRNSVGTSSSVYMSEEQAYSVLNSWIGKSVEYGSNYFDYVVDDVKTKTRVICIGTGCDNIDGGLIKDTTFTWMSEKINELSNDWHIVVIAHWLFSVRVWNKPLSNNALDGSYTSSANSLFSALDTVNNDNSKPTVECVITGHVHCDYNDSTSGGIPIIYVDTDSINSFGNYTATVGSTSEQCFDVFTIDYDNKKVYCDRIGRGVSRVISY